MQRNNIRVDFEDPEPVRLAFHHSWGDVFIHLCVADGPELSADRELRMDALLSQLESEDFD